MGYWSDNRIIRASKLGWGRLWSTWGSARVAVSEGKLSLNWANASACSQVLLRQGLLRSEPGMGTELSCKEATSYARLAGRERQLGSRRWVKCGGGADTCGKAPKKDGDRDRGELELGSTNRTWSLPGLFLPSFLPSSSLKMFLCPFS